MGTSGRTFALIGSHDLPLAGGPRPIDDLAPAQQAARLVGQSSTFLAALDRMKRVAPTDSTVLITGETGTGKELVARSLHRRSRRGSRPLVMVNLGALPESLMASELFGHEAGAFTGATHRRLGRFELADKGTLCLDEIGELTHDVQVMLLRVLQEGEINRLGASQTRQVDVRLIAVTNRDLQVVMEAGTFREDLFYRLSVFPIHLPPLRERPDGIPALILADVARKAIVQVAELVRDLLSKRMPPDKADQLAGKLATGTWTHDYAITAELAKSMGLPVSTQMPAEVYDFISLFPQPTRMRPSVEYTPVPPAPRSDRGQQVAGAGTR